MTLRNAAMRGVNAIPGDDTSYDADHVAAAINSLTAAVLYLAHTVTKINNES
jgi:hypothetical protein